MSAAPLYTDNDALHALLSKVTDLAVLPHVVYRVIEMSGSTECAVCDIGQVISVDPGFSSKLLSLANSAYYGLPRKVTSIKEAVSFLGFRQIRSLAMTVGIYDMFAGKNDENSLRRRAWWRHSVDSAVCAKFLASRFKAVNPEDAYTCGLIHLIGKSLLDRFGSAEYQLVEALMERGARDLQAEAAVYKCHHVEVAIACAEKWGFPESLIRGLNYLEPAEPGEPDSELRAIVLLSDRISDYAIKGKTEDTDQEVRTLPEWATRILKIEPNQIPMLLAEGMEAIAKAASMNL